MPDTPVTSCRLHVRDLAVAIVPAAWALTDRAVPLTPPGVPYAAVAASR